MLCNPTVLVPTLAEQVESRVRQATHGRIWNLEVTESHGRVEVRGCVPSYHAKQLALHGALELVSCDCFSAQITVDRAARV